MRRIFATGALILVFVALAAVPASAHALLKSSDPSDGAVLATAPKQVTITFTETPDPKLSVIHVLNQAGADVDTGGTQVVSGHPTELRVVLKPIGQGVYTVTWRTVSRVDGHVTGGSFSFGVGVKPTASASQTKVPTTPSPSPLDAAGRWMLYWGLALLLAGPVIGFVAFGALLPGPRVFLAGAWLLAAVGLTLMTVAERSAVGVGLGELLRSGAGQELVRQGIGLAVAAVAVGLAVARPGRRTLIALGVTSAGVMFLHAQAGHAATAAAALSRWFNEGVQWLHLLSVGVWVGGLAWLLMGTRGREGAERVTAVRRFSWLAGIAVGFVAATGVLRAVDELGGWTEWGRLVSTSFGVTILVKIGIFFGLIALGARNRYVNVPGVSNRTKAMSSLRRAVGAEVLLAAGILGATGVLTQLPPATYAAKAAQAPAPQEVVVAGHDFGTTVRVRLVATPGTVGVNRFTASVVDYDTGRPVPATSVSLRFALPSRPDVDTTLPLKKGSGGTWTGQGTALSMDGRWSVTVLVQESTTAVEVPLQLQPRLPPEKIQVSKVAGQPTLYTISLPNGGSLQTYVDPAKGGPNTVHFTFFTAGGNELPISSATGQEVGPGTQGPLKLIRFSAGHFVANVPLTAGSWRFSVTATARDGTTLTGYFNQTIGG